MGKRNQVKGIICQICVKVYKLNRGLLNRCVNYLEKAFYWFT